MVFNVLVDYVIRNWVTVVSSTEAGIDGISILVQDPAEYFCTDGILVALTQMERLHILFDVPTELFDHVCI